jgi:hypothetical protein
MSPNISFKPKAASRLGSIQALGGMDGYPNIDAWAAAYIAVNEARANFDESHPDYLAAYCFMQELVGPVAEECWQGILAVVRRQPSEWVLGMLAAGPMEDLVMCSGADFIGRIELEARRNPDFRRMLHGVWSSGTPEVWARLVAARGSSENAA